MVVPFSLIRYMLVYLRNIWTFREFPIISLCAIFSLIYLVNAIESVSTSRYSRDSFISFPCLDYYFLFGRRGQRDLDENKGSTIFKVSVMLRRKESMLKTIVH